MSYLIFCTFDLKGASSEDYKAAYAELEKLGLNRVIVSDEGTDVVIPTTAVVGKFNGAGASSLRDDVRGRVQKAFRVRGLKSEIFVVVGGTWAWGAGTT